MWVEAIEIALSWDKQLYSLQVAEQSRNYRVVFCSEIWCSKWFICILVLCPIIMYILFAFPMIKSVSVCHRNDAGDCSHDRVNYVVFWSDFGQIVTVLKDHFFYCFKYFAYCFQWQSFHSWWIVGLGRVPIYLHRGDDLLHSSFCAIVFRKGIMASSVKNHQPNVA